MMLLWEDFESWSAEGRRNTCLNSQSSLSRLAELGSQEYLGLKKKRANDFDLDHFVSLWLEMGFSALRDEQSDGSTLAIAEEKKWTYFQKPINWLSTVALCYFNAKTNVENCSKPISSLDFSPKEATIIKEVVLRLPCSSQQKSRKHAGDRYPNRKRTSLRWLA